METGNALILIWIGIIIGLIIAGYWSLILGRPFWKKAKLYIKPLEWNGKDEVWIKDYWVFCIEKCIYSENKYIAEITDGGDVPIFITTCESKEKAKEILENEYQKMMEEILKNVKIY